jgi:DHA2 family multidrug resistance protein
VATFQSNGNRDSIGKIDRVNIRATDIVQQGPSVQFPPLAAADRSPSVPIAPVVIIPPFGPRIIIGMIGVLIAVIMSAVNYYSTDINMGDIQGGFLFGHDEAAWARSLFEVGMVLGMTFAPWCVITFSVKRFCLVMTATMMIVGIVFPFAPNLVVFYVLRFIQGLSGGFLTPILLTVALRYCPPKYCLYAFGAYALSSNFGPNMALPVAAWSSDYGGYSWIFWNIVPFSVISIAAVAYGIPKDPLRLDRFKAFDWVGVLTGVPAISALVIAASQCDRLNWFASPLFCLLLVGGGLLFCFFLVNEWFHPAPIFNLRILARSNFLHSVIGIVALVVIFLGVVEIPIFFLSEMKGYRPADVAPLALIIALPQLMILPAVSTLLNIERVDCRLVFAVGLGLVAYSCYLATFITSDWVRADFYFIVALLALGEAMTILPLLMFVIADMAPDEGPYVSAMFNSMKGFASVFITTLLEGVGHIRTQYHSSIITSQLGRNPLAYEERLAALNHHLGSAIGDEGARADASVEMLAHQVHAQSYTLAMADMYRVLLLLTLAMILLTGILPTRLRPPRAATAR